MKKRRGLSFGGAVFLVLIVAMVYTVFFVEFIICPVCEGDLILQAVCNTCGRDGELTLLDAIRSIT